MQTRSCASLQSVLRHQFEVGSHCALCRRHRGGPAPGLSQSIVRWKLCPARGSCRCATGVGRPLSVTLTTSICSPFFAFHPAFFLLPLSFPTSINVTCALDDTFRSQMVPKIPCGSKGHRMQVRLEKRLYYDPCDVPFDAITKTQALRC